MKKIFTLIVGTFLFAQFCYSQTYNDGPSNVQIRVGQLYAENYDDLVFDAENSWKIWARDRQNLDGQDWLGGNCFEWNAGSGSYPLTTGFFGTVLLNQNYGATVPSQFDVQIDAWEDDCNNRCEFNPLDLNPFSAGFCQDSDDRHCGVTTLASNIDYRAAGPPCRWNNNGWYYQCGNDYGARMESYWRYNNGENCATPIALGAIGAGGSISHYNSNECYGNSYSGTNAQPSNDVFYSFTTSQPMGVTITTCNSADFDTYIHLLDNNCNQLLSNDDNTGQCSGLTSELYAWLCTPGTYKIVVEGWNSNEGVFTLSILDRPSMTPSIVSSATDADCFGNATGSATATASQGNGGWTYLWSNGTSGNNLSGVTAGNYTVTATDVLGCIQVASAFISEPSQMNSTISLNDIACNGSNDGNATVLVSGGTGAYTYNWSNGGTTSQINNLAPGSYGVTVTDDNGCTHDNSVTLGEPAALSATFSVVNSNCNGTPDGAIFSNISGGTPPYQHFWNTGATTSNLQNVPGGNYTLQVLDANNCPGIFSVTVGQPQLVSVSFITNDATCQGLNDGSTTAIATGGGAPYSYSWGGGLNTASISNLAPGSYSVTVTDVNSCTATGTTVVGELSGLSLTTGPDTSVCVGERVDLFANSTPGVTYNWSPAAGLNSTTIPNPIAFPTASTNYVVTITEGTGCVKVDTVTITINEPTAPFLGNDTVFCGTPTTWTLDAGNGYASYIWNTAETTQSITVNSTFKYRVTVTDQNGCVGESNEINIVFNSPITPTIVGTNVSSTCTADGFADLSVSGGTPPYTYFWSTGSTTEDIGPLGVGTYFVNVSDFNGCTATEQVVISGPTALNLTAVATDVTCNGMANGSISLGVSGGNGPYSFNWSNGSTDQNQTSLAAGSYSITLTDAANCTVSTSQSIGEPAVLKATITGTDVTATAGTNGHATLVVTGGTGPFSYAWSNGSAMQNLNGIMSGQYSVTVTDANGCQSSDTVDIMEPFCAAPLNPFTAFVTSNSARLNWLPVSGADHYRIRGRRIGNPGWVNLHIGYTTPTFKNVFGLANNAEFEWQIRAFCDSGDSIYSAWSELDTFMTGCFAPEFTFEAVVSAGAASLNWARVFGAKGYEIKGKPVGTLVAQTILVPPTDTFKHIFGLNSNTQYEWRVRTWCDTMGVRKSDFTPFDYFTTTGAARFEQGLNPENGNLRFEFNAFPNPVDHMLNLIVNSESTQESTLRLVALNGKKVLEEQILLVEGEQKLEFSVNDFAEGVYHIEIVGEDFKQSQRIMIMK